MKTLIVAALAVFSLQALAYDDNNADRNGFEFYDSSHLSKTRHADYTCTPGTAEALWEADATNSRDNLVIYKCNSRGSFTRSVKRPMIRRCTEGASQALWIADATNSRDNLVTFVCKRGRLVKAK